MISILKGLTAELLGLEYLKTHLGGDWHLTERHSYEDNCGVDAIGILADGKRLFVQIKSSLEKGQEFKDERPCRFKGNSIPVLVVDGYCMEDIDWA